MHPPPRRRGSAAPTQRPRAAPRRRQRGDLNTRDFLALIFERLRACLPVDLGEAQHIDHAGWLIKLWDDEPLIHFELWPHRARGRVELGLHFETRNAARNVCLLDYVADELLFLKEALGHGLEAEPWDKGWTRVYITYPLDRLGPAEAAHLGEAFALFVETLEPVRREAVEACGE